MRGGGGINEFKSRKFRMNRIPPDDFLITKKREKNWSANERSPLAPFWRRCSTSASQAKMPSVQKRTAPLKKGRGRDTEEKRI